MGFSGFVCAGVLAGFSWAAAAPAMDTLRPAEDSTPLWRNPGKGWVFYTTRLGSLSPDMRARGSLCYRRFNWRDLEPNEGQYRWDLVQAEIDSARAYGMKYAFGVMNASAGFAPADGYVTPKWVFAAGARGYQVKDVAGIVNVVPYWKDNPVFLAKLDRFAAALGARFDGDTNLAYVDIRTYGNWGEGHLGFIDKDGTGAVPEPAAADMPALYYQPYRTAFPRTQLILPWGHHGHDSAYAWCVANGIGLRRDGIPDWSDGTDIARAFGHEPTAVEYTADLQTMIANGTWDDAKVAAAIGNAHASYAEIGRGDAGRFLADKAPLMRSLANRLGYHFVLEEAAVPKAGIAQGEAFPVAMRWANRGVSFLYHAECRVALALLDAHQAVADTCILSGADPRAWAPGETRFESQARFRSAPPGTYRLAVGLLGAAPGSKPVFRIGNLGRTPEGWYVLADSVRMGPGGEAIRDPAGASRPALGPAPARAFDALGRWRRPVRRGPAPPPERPRSSASAPSP